MAMLIHRLDFLSWKKDIGLEMGSQQYGQESSVILEGNDFFCNRHGE
jgi:hypothetical protein